MCAKLLVFLKIVLIVCFIPLFNSLILRNIKVKIMSVYIGNVIHSNAIEDNHVMCEKHHNLEEEINYLKKKIS